MAARYVVLGLALSRSSWFRNVAQWCHSASIPVEFVKAGSPVEVRAHLASGRAFSALLADAGVPQLDRDLVDQVRATGCAVIVVDDPRVARDWSSMGVDAVINPVFDRNALLEVLAARASEIVRAEVLPGEIDLREPSISSGALVVMVCGPGGCGASTVSIALAQGLAHDPRHAGAVLLADLARRADQAMLHDAGDVVPSLQELVEAHRSGHVSVGDALGYTFAVEERSYRLLLGLRRPSNWTAVRPRAFAAALETLREGWKAVVCDTDADVEGEAECGSVDVEDRNRMSRSVADVADVVLVVGQPGMKGVHSIVRVVSDLLDHGVPGARIVPVVNRAPRAPRSRGEIAAALAALLAGRSPSSELGVAAPVFLPETDIDAALRDGVRLPPKFAAAITQPVLAIADRVGRRPIGTEAIRVTPGSLGAWSESTAP